MLKIDKFKFFGKKAQSVLTKKLIGEQPEPIQEQPEPIQNKKQKKEANN